MLDVVAWILVVVGAGLWWYATSRRELARRFVEGRKPAVNLAYVGAGSLMLATGLLVAFIA